MIFKFLEKWALERLLKRVAENIPLAQDRLTEIWDAHKDEIFEKVTSAVEQAITKILKKALEKQGIKVSDISNN